MKLYILPGDRFLLVSDEEMADDLAAEWMRLLREAWSEGNGRVALIGHPVEVIDLRIPR